MILLSDYLIGIPDDDSVSGIPHTDYTHGHTSWADTGRYVLIINVTLFVWRRSGGGDTRPVSCSGSLQCSGGKGNAQESSVGGG